MQVQEVKLKKVHDVVWICVKYWSGDVVSLVEVETRSTNLQKFGLRMGFRTVMDQPVLNAVRWQTRPVVGDKEKGNQPTHPYQPSSTDGMGNSE